MTLTTLNQLPAEQLQDALFNCCGSHSWVKKMLVQFPFEDEDSLYSTTTETWYQCNEDDWREAFTHHPKIGDIDSLKKKFAATAQWASGEQSSVNTASQQMLEGLAEGNKAYEEKFGYIFIVCATGKGAEEMLVLLQARLNNTPDKEILIAMEEQNKITHIRLSKLLSE